eukprot:CAMPEP_0179871516 /NCGR_PEP_ID=MMETSP0982-20121206/20951_1 /TAXON_ID=483367 /ORGANISM="non described non described, Strain CCMP 2436" /LENGTH=138 /DNA_ID=CAMNT_0021762359 /DNA_START=79 /DNA_END=493 /DNA_ORIENTATION=+
MLNLHHAGFRPAIHWGIRTLTSQQGTLAHQSAGAPHKTLEPRIAAGLRLTPHSHSQPNASRLARRKLDATAPAAQPIRRALPERGATASLGGILRLVVLLVLVLVVFVALVLIFVFVVLVVVVAAERVRHHERPHVEQ